MPRWTSTLPARLWALLALAPACTGDSRPDDTGGGYFKTGRHVDLPGRSHNDLLLSLMHAMGVPGATFGDPAHCTGPISELV
ncbi:MAG TPA: hypothetical protein VIK91_19820 [Nannocystis sp.]